MNLVSGFPGAYEQQWFRQRIDHLEHYRTDRGTYLFPKEYLPEKKNSYYLYSGAHLGLGEKGGQALEIESTFRMLSIRKRAGLILG